MSSIHPPQPSECVHLARNRITAVLLSSHPADAGAGGNPSNKTIRVKLLQDNCLAEQLLGGTRTKRMGSFVKRWDFGGRKTDQNMLAQFWGGKVKTTEIIRKLNSTRQISFPNLNLFGDLKKNGWRVSRELYNGMLIISTQPTLHYKNTFKRLARWLSR